MIPHEFVSVQGARLEAVNGLYLKVDTFDNDTMKYTKIDRYQGESLEFSLYQYSYSWWISLVEMGLQPGEGTDIDFYQNGTESDIPPLTGWSSMDEDHNPAPFVSVEHIGATSPDAPDELSTVSVLKSVAETYKKMLFSEKFSDIKFICSNGVTLHAHRSVLAEASTYFDNMFQGPWRENKAREIKPPHSSHIMKVVLTILYTGKIDFGLVDDDPLAFISVASEYDVASLKVVAESCSVRSLNETNIKRMLQAAHLYDCLGLKSACAEYVNKNSLALLRNTEITSLKTDNPHVWDELWEAVDRL